MFTAYVIVALLTSIANTFSGIVAVARLKPVLPVMAAVGVPESWLVFPIGTLKLAGAAGLLVGLAVPLVGTAAAIGLVLYFGCAIYLHVRARDYSAQFGLAIVFQALAIATLALDLVAR